MTISISFMNRSTVPEDPDFSPPIPAGEVAIMRVQGARLWSELATLLPNTSITPLASHPATNAEETHIYMVALRGYSLREFEDIVSTLLSDDYDRFLELVSHLRTTVGDL